MQYVLLFIVIHRKEKQIPRYHFNTHCVDQFQNRAKLTHMGLLIANRNTCEVLSESRIRSQCELTSITTS